MNFKTCKLTLLALLVNADSRKFCLQDMVSVIVPYELYIAVRKLTAWGSQKPRC